MMNGVIFFMYHERIITMSLYSNSIVQGVNGHPGIPGTKGEAGEPGYDGRQGEEGDCGPEVDALLLNPISITYSGTLR